MKYSFDPILRPITDKQIDELEGETKGKFPTDYRTFLLTYNGGFPNPKTFRYSKHSGCDRSVQEQSELNNSGLIHFFFGIGDSLEDGDLQKEIKLVGNSLPEGFIPIGTTQNGDEICLSLRTQDYGYIYLWKHGELVDSDENMDECYNVYFISSGFIKMLDNLY